MNPIDTKKKTFEYGSALTSAPPTYAAHEMTLRRQDKDGNTLPQKHTYTTQLAGDRPLEETPYAPALATLRQMDPLRADMLHAQWETGVRVANRTIQQIRHEEEEALASRNRRAVEENARIDADQQAQFAACKEAMQPHLTEGGTLKTLLNDLHSAAAAAVARTGGSYNPDNPSEADVLRISPRPLPVIAGDLKLPFPEADGLTHMHPLVARLATIGFGILFGISFGLISGFLHAGSLLRHPLVLLLCLGAGAVWAFLSRYFLLATSERASDRYYLGHGPRSWVPFLVVTVALLVIVLFIDAVVGQAGVLGMAHAKAIAHSLAGDTYEAGRGGAAWLVALAFALPYSGYAVWEGYAKGMYTPVMNRLKARQDAETRLAEAQRRGDAQVQEALNRVADVKDGLRQQAEYAGRMRDIAAPYLAKNQALEQQRLPVRDRLEETAQQRVDQAIHQARGVQEEWNREFAHALEESSPASRR